MNNQIPYKLSNVIYHLPKLLDSFSAGGLREVKNYFKLNGYDLTIQHYGVETLLDIIMKEICVEGNWNELSYNMEYNNFEKKQLSLFFKNFYNNYANKTLMYQEFFAELLQSNLNDLVETGDIDFRDIANLKNSTIIDVDQMKHLIANKVCDYKVNSEWITEFHNLILDAENKSINNYLDDIYYYVENTVQEQELSAVERFYLQSWVFNGLVKNIVFNIDPNDELVDFTYDIKSLNELKKYFNSSYWYDLEKIGFFDDIPEVEGIMNEDVPYRIGQTVEFDDLNDNGFLVKNTGVIENITNSYYLINVGTKKIKYALGQKLKVLNDSNDDGFVANAYYTISNSISLEIEIADSGDALRIKDNNNVSDWLPIDYKFDEYSVNEEDTFPYVMYGEMEIDLNDVMILNNNDLGNEITTDTLINDDLENDIYDNYEIEINTLDILNKYQEEKSLKGNAEFTLESDDNTYQVEFEYLNNSNQLNLFDIETLDGIVVEFNKNNLEIIKNEIIHQLNIYNELNIEDNENIIENIITEDDGLDEEELENERPFQPEDQNLLLTILDNLDKNFPTPRVEFYYPFENVECSTLMSLEKINNFLSVENEDYESIMVVDDYKLVSLMPDIIEFEDLLRRLYTNIPDSELEIVDEDILYMNLSDGTNSIKLKIYISGELHDILAN